MKVVTTYMRKGNLTSIIAAFTILAELIYLGALGLKAIFSPFSLSLVTIIYFQGIIAFIFYHFSLRSKFFLIDVLIGLIIEFVSIYFLFLHSFVGVILLLIGYISEPIAGILLFKYFYELHKTYALMFFLGAIIFTAGLPFYVINLPYVAIIGDLVKVFGLIQLRRYI
ncbi:MAG: hypothetical protein QXR34_10525 [Saccharolobus sp.]